LGQREVDDQLVVFAWFESGEQHLADGLRVGRRGTSCRVRIALDAGDGIAVGYDDHVHLAPTAPSRTCRGTETNTTLIVVAFGRGRRGDLAYLHAGRLETARR